MKHYSYKRIMITALLGMILMLSLTFCSAKEKSVSQEGESVEQDMHSTGLPEKFSFDENGVARIQAEHMKIFGDVYTYARLSDDSKTVIANNKAGATEPSGGDYLGFTQEYYDFLGSKIPDDSTQYKRKPDLIYEKNGSQPNAQAVLEIPEDGHYYVWARVRWTQEEGGASFLYLGIDAPPDTAVSVGAAQPKEGGLGTDDENDWNAGTWRWELLTSTELEAGAHSLNLLAGKGGIDIDYVIVSNQELYVPVGIDGGLVTGRRSLSDNLTQYVEAAPMVGEHPRLFFKESDLNTIRANMNHEENAYALAELNNYLARTDLNVIKKEFNATLLTYIEALAFDYALNGTTTNGLKAKEMMSSYLMLFSVDTAAQDYSRQVGAVILSAAEVLDWCYDLFSDNELLSYTTLVENQAELLEFGYETWADQGGSFSGHATELMYQCDLLAYGVAIYDKYPDIYNYTAGKIYRDFVPARSFWYQANTHHQGDSYGIYRIMSDLWADAIISKMSGQHLYPEELSTIVSQWIYTRRPDGTLFRNGDNYNETFTPEGNYWNITAPAAFLIANLYDNEWAKLAKSEFLKESNGGNFFSLGEMTVTPAKFLILNNPTQETMGSAQLPLTKYFGSPYGSMTARTGWNLGADSPDVLADMRIVERWASNHAHLDVGSFQLYYKGILASESGIYDSYWSEHDKQYNKQSVAHNTLAIYDPNGKMQHLAGEGQEIANSGGQRMAGIDWTGEEIKDISYFDDDEYTYGEVINHEAGPNINKPEYSFISGDITPAYNIPGEPDYDRATEVKRSMLFMPGSDVKYPGTMVVFDKVVSTDAGFHKAWLLHMQSEPIVDESNHTITVNSEFGGKMVVEPLLPAKYEVEKLEGYQIGYGDMRKNYAPENEEKFKDTSTEHGWGRIEISPREVNTEDYFLNVLTVTDQGTEVVNSILIGTEDDPYYGVRFRDQVAIFSKDARVQINSDEADFIIPGKGQVTVVYTGLKPGTWIVNGEEIQTTAEGILYFTSQEGAVSLQYKNSETKVLDDSKETKEDGYAIMVGSNYLYSPVSAYAEDDCIMAELNTVADVQKAEISRNGDKVTMTKQIATLVFTIGDSVAYLNGKAFELPEKSR